MSTTPTALIVFAHGSRVESANDAVREVCRSMAEAAGQPVQAAFLELGQPDLAAALESAVGSGALRVVIIPYFLTLGLHLQRDLPKLVRKAEAAHPGVRIEVTPPLDGHPSMVGILLDRAAQVTNGATS